MHFSRKIKELRKEKEITQVSLSEKLNVPRSTVANWEQERCEPSIKDLIELSKLLGVSVGYLVGAEDEDGRPVPQDLSKKDLDLLRAFHKLTAFEQETVMVQINALAESKESQKQ